MNKAKCALIFVSNMLCVSPALAGAVAGATEPTQIMNNIQLVQQYSESARQTVTQIRQYESMLKNLASSTPSYLLGQQAVQLWRNQNMTQTFRNLQTLVVGGQRISYNLQNQDQMFRRVHPGYGGNFNSKTEYKNWSDNSMSAVQSALSVSGAQAENFSNEESMMQELQTRSQTADGQVKVLQAGNDIGVAMVGQMQQLRQLQMAQINAQSQYMSKETSVTDAKKTSSAIVFGNLKSSKVVQGSRTVPSGE